MKKDPIDAFSKFMKDDEERDSYIPPVFMDDYIELENIVKPELNKESPEIVSGKIYIFFGLVALISISIMMALK